MQLARNLATLAVARGAADEAESASAAVNLVSTSQACSYKDSQKWTSSVVTFFPDLHSMKTISNLTNAKMLC